MIYDWSLEWARENELALTCLEETFSTNTLAKDDTRLERPQLDDVYAGFSEPMLYITRRQTAGRGRGSHVWSMPETGAFTGSWCFAIARVPQPIFSALVGLAVYEAAQATWPSVAFNIKAPNDLFIDNKKVAGILIETIDQGVEKRTIIGLGMNTSSSPTGVEVATCLNDHLPSPLTRDQWFLFMDALLLRLRDALRAGSRERLTPDAAERLRVALNRHPLLKEPILRVDELGQLYSASRVIHWHEL